MTNPTNVFPTKRFDANWDYLNELYHRGDEGGRRDLAALPRALLDDIDKCILSLAENPRAHGCKKLKGYKGLYRVRMGNYRIIYQIEDKKLIIVIVRVGDRKEIYKL